jgi:hypothetical protein
MVLGSACLGAFDNSLSTALCDSFAAIAHGLPVVWLFCLYHGVDAGALVGAQTTSDVPEMCNGTSFTMTGGELRASCYLPL